MNGEYIYVIAVLLMKSDDGVSVNEYLWSDNPEFIHTFIKQHSIDKNVVTITPFAKDDAQSIQGIIDMNKEIDKLQPYYFQSSIDNTIHRVITNSKFIGNIVEMLGRDIVDCMSFGELVTREDVEFSTKMSDLIDSLPYGAVYDWSDIDETVDQYQLSNDEYEQCTYEDYYHSRDFGFTFDPLWADSNNASSNETPQPFTLEAYAHYFPRCLLI